jgi:hypothetical protein
MMMRIISRRAQVLAQRLGSSNNRSNNITNIQKPPAVVAAEVPWPPSIRYAFYVACILAIPMSIGQALALSPTLRDSLLGEDDDDVIVEEYNNSTNSKSRGIARTIIDYVRWYWGKEEYIPPIDLQYYNNNHTAAADAATPGFRNKWEEDDYSSFLHLIGLYPPTNEKEKKAQQQQTTRLDIPISLDNEPCQQIRHTQSQINQYLHNGWIKVRFTLLPIIDNDSIGNTTPTLPCYETECTIPTNIIPTNLRSVIHGCNAQTTIRDLLLSSSATTTQGGGTTTTTDYERIRTHGWNKDCYWVISFPDNDNTATSDATSTADDDDIVVMNDGTFYSSSDNNHSYGSAMTSTTATTTSAFSATAAAALHLRRNTAIHSSWTYFPNNTTTTTAPLASSLGSSSSSTTTNKRVDDKQLLISKLQYQIQQIQTEINDSNSLRNIDNMYEEINSYKNELRKLVPWYKRWSI